MANTFIVRKYQATDREPCRSLWRELTEWHQEIYHDPTIGGDHPENFFDEHLNVVGVDRLWVAVKASQVVGLVGLETQDEELVVEPLIVATQYRDLGIGTELLQTAIAEAKKLGVKTLSVKPVARNQKAIQFFFKHGFQTLGHIQLFLDFRKTKWKKGPLLFECNFTY